MRPTPPKTLLPILLCALLCWSGCGSTRVVYIPHGEPVRLAEPVEAHVWVPGADGQAVRSDNTITIPEGWYALPKD